MDVVECEAPLDSSFQKDRLELVNKGSLGRRRKPSRSNLRLILSPANDQQDVDVFHSPQHFDSGGSFSQEKVTTSLEFEEFHLDNQPDLVTESRRLKNSSNSLKKENFPGNSPLSIVSNGYREVVQSINHINSVKSVDWNGNNHQSGLVTSGNHPNCKSSVDHKELIRNSHWQRNSDNNNVNCKQNFWTSVIKTHQSVSARNHNESSKLSNEIPAKTHSDGYHNSVTQKNQKPIDSKTCQQIVKAHNGHNNQQIVASKNHKNIITFSNRRQIVITPVHSKNSDVPNGNHHDLTSSKEGSSKLYIESSLPRTSKEPDLVAEARQFSIEAKLKRKKSEVQGRSAVLIQTWERRTLSESFCKVRRDSKSALKNRFTGKEIADAMPDSYICIKYKGSLENGDNLLKGELLPEVRDVRQDETMLYRTPEDRHRTSQPVGTANGKVTANGKPKQVQEPEWISLSRKLCAKFVEGHIEPNSPDSCPLEEPEGIVVEPTTPCPPPSNKTQAGTKTDVQTEIQKRKTAPTTPSEETPHSGDGEPPWVHLSRKLCTKFIEEHIEYPPITNGHFVEVPELVEPNGDVRIIEKIGKPKSKSKQKKESEPEWVSLSKRLRAKFIESHIDDPDTIALDSQLNVSDPEETGSETLSDISQETPVPRVTAETLEPVECKNFTVKCPVEDKLHRNENQNNESESTIYPEKECVWEYQEMEFDQESNSGNFHESNSLTLEASEYSHQSHLQEAKIHRGSLPEDSSSQFQDERVTFENSRFFRNAECYSNDVNFAPRFTENESAADSPQQNKVITVQFIARTRCERNNGDVNTNILPNNGQVTRHNSFFDVATWGEAHYNDDGDQPQSKNEKLCKDHRSKSLDYLCDSLEVKVSEQNQDLDRNHNENSLSDVFDDDEKFQQKSNEFVDETGHLQGFREDLDCASDVSSLKENANNASEDMVDSERENKRTSWDRLYHQEKKQNIPDRGDLEPRNEFFLKEKSDCSSGSIVIETENKMVNCDKFQQHAKKQNILDPKNAESSSEDEVFELSCRKKSFSSSSSEAAHYGHISSKNNSLVEYDQKQTSNKKVKNEKSTKNNNSVKCNGVIPNSVYNDFPDNKMSASKYNQNESNSRNGSKEPVKLGMSKWITISKSEQNISKPEYSNVQSSILNEQKSRVKSSENRKESKNKLPKNCEKTKKNESKTVSNVSTRSMTPKYENRYSSNYNQTGGDSDEMKESDLKTKCKSMCDISYINKSMAESNFRQHESVADLCAATRASTNSPKIEFQHFECDSDIPLCAKLVSKHDKRTHSKSIPSALPIYRTESPCPSESSHLYEDMFKETPSGPSDSEASSWTVMKNNTYYVNGRSSSMNDLDFSDSCSMSVKCDYASSSENSTLQSRHSSYASSSFYVNLRDYDSHMLEPSLNKEKRNNCRMASSGTAANISKSNPPTPESLRHLFTSPLSSINSPANRAPRMLNRIPSDPQSHYYSTAAFATSSAFKHGFSLTSPKPKKTERSSSMKIKDIAHGIILTFKKFHNSSKNISVSASQVDVSHLAEMKSNSELGKTKKGQKDSKKQNQDNCVENGKTDTDSGFLSDGQRAKARRSSSDLTGMKSNSELFHSDKKKGKHSKKSSNRDKGKKSKSKTSEPRTVPTVSRKVQQLADGTLCLVTTVSGDTSMPGVYSDSPDTSSELSGHRPVKPPEESNC